MPPGIKYNFKAAPPLPHLCFSLGVHSYLSSCQSNALRQENRYLRQEKNTTQRQNIGIIEGGLLLSYYPKRVLFAAANQSLSSAVSIIGLSKDGYPLSQQYSLLLCKLPLLILQNICFNGRGLNSKMVTIRYDKGIPTWALPTFLDKGE